MADLLINTFVCVALIRFLGRLQVGFLGRQDWPCIMSERGWNKVIGLFQDLQLKPRSVGQPPVYIEVCLLPGARVSRTSGLQMDRDGVIGLLQGPQ